MSQHHSGIEMSIFGGGGKRNNCKIWQSLPATFAMNTDIHQKTQGKISQIKTRMNGLMVEDEWELIKNPFRSGGDGVLALSSGNCPLPGFSENYNMIPFSSFLSGFWLFFVCFYLESQQDSFLVLFIWILVIFCLFFSGITTWFFFSSNREIKCFLFSVNFPLRKIFSKTVWPSHHKRDKAQTSSNISGLCTYVENCISSDKDKVQTSEVWQGFH